MEKTQESINKDLKDLKNKHTETNNTITEIKNSLEGISSRISEKEQISELEDKMVEITPEETENSLRDLSDNIKCTNVRIIGGPRRRREKKEYEKTFEEIIVENFPNMEKEIVNKVQQAERVPCRRHSRRNMPRHILIKLTKTKHKERIIKAAREKQQVIYKGNHIRLTADLSVETLQARRECQGIFKVLKRKTLQQR